MSREQDIEKLRSDNESGMPPVAAAYSIVARGVFGPSPAEVFEQTRGGVGHFYYVYLMVLYVVTCFGWLPIPPDHVVRGFLVDHLGYHRGNWFEIALLLLLLVKVAIAIVLRVVLFPVGPDGRADWRWKRWQK